jgi:ATP:ADP antiporter, AAA family
VQDVLVVTAPGSGAEIIPFLKTWVNLPMAIGFTVLYAKVSGSWALVGWWRLLQCWHIGGPLQLANVLSSEALFYTCIIPFIIFFGCFAAFMYPLREVLHPTGA